jgi:hypothetical protein
MPARVALAVVHTAQSQKLADCEESVCQSVCQCGSYLQAPSSGMKGMTARIWLVAKPDSVLLLLQCVNPLCAGALSAPALAKMP